MFACCSWVLEIRPNHDYRSIIAHMVCGMLVHHPLGEDATMTHYLPLYRCPLMWSVALSPFTHDDIACMLPEDITLQEQVYGIVVHGQNAITMYSSLDFCLFVVVLCRSNSISVISLW